MDVDEKVIDTNQAIIFHPFQRQVDIHFVYHDGRRNLSSMWWLVDGMM
jgi:hypothetical protein